jgi:hypothetical protein
MSYTINYSDSSKAPFLLPSLVADSTLASLTFTGRGAKNFGQIQQQNYLHLLENFASPDEPAHPIEGQTWYDTSTSAPLLKVYNGTKFNPIADPAFQFLGIIFS